MATLVVRNANKAMVMSVVESGKDYIWLESKSLQSSGQFCDVVFGVRNIASVSVKVFHV